MYYGIQSLKMEITEQLKKAKETFDKGNFDYCVEVLAHLLSDSPSSAEARHLLHLAKQQRAKSSSTIQKTVQTLLTLPRLITAKIVESKNKDNRWKIIEAYENVLSVDPFNTLAMIAIANLFVAENQPQAAVQTLQEILVGSPNHVPALKQLTQLYLQLDQPVQAREYFQQILKIDPKNSEAERNLKNLDAMDAIRGMKEEAHS